MLKICAHGVYAAGVSHGQIVPYPILEAVDSAIMAALQSLYLYDKNRVQVTDDTKTSLINFLNGIEVSFTGDMDSTTIVTAQITIQKPRSDDESKLAHFSTTRTAPFNASIGYSVVEFAEDIAEAVRQFFIDRPAPAGMMYQNDNGQS